VFLVKKWDKLGKTGLDQRVWKLLLSAALNLLCKSESVIVAMQTIGDNSWRSGSS
jgi:hypothetical protein